MSETTRQKAEAILKEVEATSAVLLPEPAPADQVPALAEADAPVGDEIRKRMNEIDISDTNSIVVFGSAAQAELQQISQAMLADVKNKDVGPAGDSLRDIVSTIRGFSVEELDPNRKQGFLARL